MRRGSCALGVLVIGLVGRAGAAEPKPGDAPPPEYYVEPSQPPVAAPAAVQPRASAMPPGGVTSAPPLSAAPSSAPPGAPPAPPGDPDAGPIYDPPPPGFDPPGEGFFEPPPPPEPHHIAPRTALWLGARVGLFVPFGNGWARGTPDSDGFTNYRGVPWRDYVGAGPMFELDAGARLSRNYNLFGLWERAQLGSGRGDPDAGVGKSDHGSSDFWGAGIRATSNPDRVGFVTELAIGYRRANAKYDDGEVKFSDAPFEARLGVGADIRITPYFSLSPMATLGVGSFGKVERITGGASSDARAGDDADDGHAWGTVTLGGHFDLFGSEH